VGVAIDVDLMDRCVGGVHGLHARDADKLPLPLKGQFRASGLERTLDLATRLQYSDSWEGCHRNGHVHILLQVPWRLNGWC
jgi:hypothetical protein